MTCSENLVHERGHWCIGQRRTEPWFAFYHHQRRGLGDRFKVEILAPIQRLVAFPAINTEIDHGIRRCLVIEFPNMVIYAHRADHIDIIAIAHQHRRPGYWA